MAFRSEVDNTIDVLVLHQLIDPFKVADVHFDKLVVRFALDIFQIGEISRVGQLVKVDDFIFGIFVHEKANNMAADESGAAGDDNGSRHGFGIYGLRFTVCDLLFVINCSFS